MSCTSILVGTEVAMTTENGHRYQPRCSHTVNHFARAETELGRQGQGPAAEKEAPRGPWACPDPHLQVSVDYEAGMHMFKAQDDLTGIKSHLLLRKHPMLGEVVMHVATCNQRPEGKSQTSMRGDRGHLT